jgi:hypothetical protein
MNKQTIIAAVIGVVLLAGAGYLLFLQPPSADTLTASEPTSPAETTFVNLASQLEPLGFDTSILTDPRFMALVDIHTAILPEAVGRRDPFAP